MECRCNDATEFYGDEAEQYAAEHLVRGSVDSERFEERFSCPDTGRDWVLDWPERTDREPGPARLVAQPAT